MHIIDGGIEFLEKHKVKGGVAQNLVLFLNSQKFGEVNVKNMPHSPFSLRMYKKKKNSTSYQFSIGYNFGQSGRFSRKMSSFGKLHIYIVQLVRVLTVKISRVLYKLLHRRTPLMSYVDKITFYQIFRFRTWLFNEVDIIFHMIVYY